MQCMVRQNLSAPGNPEAQTQGILCAQPREHEHIAQLHALRRQQLYQVYDPHCQAGWPDVGQLLAVPHPCSPEPPHKAWMSGSAPAQDIQCICSTGVVSSTNIACDTPVQQAGCTTDWHMHTCPHPGAAASTCADCSPSSGPSSGPPRAPRSTARSTRWGTASGTRARTGCTSPRRRPSAPCSGGTPGSACGSCAPEAARRGARQCKVRFAKRRTRTAS